VVLAITGELLGWKNMSQAGEFLTRATVWVALTLYVGCEFARRRASNCAGRWLNAAGCAAFLAHVVCAFHFYHSWSHTAAYAATAHQTVELTGWDSGFGLYINYVFAAVWFAEAVWSWVTPTYAARPVWITRTIRAFFWFMIFNGAVVFAHGPLRAFGLLLSLALIVCWWRARFRLGSSMR